MKKLGIRPIIFAHILEQSEHQTGLCLDLCIFRDGNYIAKEINESKPEIKWVHLNAPSIWFYFALSPPASSKNKDEINPITGYKYEPWHLRYVEKDLAGYLFNNQLTLVEYYMKEKHF